MSFFAKIGLLLKNTANSPMIRILAAGGAGAGIEATYRDVCPYFKKSKLKANTTNTNTPILQVNTSNEESDTAILDTN